MGRERGWLVGFAGGEFVVGLGSEDCAGTTCLGQTFLQRGEAALVLGSGETGMDHDSLRSCALVSELCSAAVASTALAIGIDDSSMSNVGSCQP